MEKKILEIYIFIDINILHKKSEDTYFNDIRIYTISINQENQYQRAYYLFEEIQHVL